MEKVKEMRKNVIKRAREQAGNMVNTSNKRMKVAEVGSTVKIRVPDVDRGRTNHRNVLGVIMEEIDSMYRIGTKNGVLEHWNQFDLCKESFLEVQHVKADTVISLRTAIGKASISGSSQGFVRCLCAKGCNTNKCQCRKSGVLCNSKCHRSSSCSNKM